MTIRPDQPADEDAVIALWRLCDLVVPWNDPKQERFVGPAGAVRHQDRDGNRPSFAL